MYKPFKLPSNKQLFQETRLAIWPRACDNVILLN